ncbi:TIGR00300 family protein [Haladaptatus sp. DJG-WS-42]|uniref:ornithine cyclodeaminase n=1 Tax=Haladaptatus sp. DJG-WS-42 TaxID=3120516 RepID=UPI0030D1025E
MSVSSEVELEGHIIDSGMMQACFGIIMDFNGWFNVEEFDIGRQKTDESYARLTVSAETEEDLSRIMHELHQSGANPSDVRDVELDPAPRDQVVPIGFYSTTNHPTWVRYEDEWLAVEDIEMDCAVVIDTDEKRAYTKVLNGIEEGDLVVTGESGIKVKPPERPREAGGAFGFMQGGISSERPSQTTISNIADAMQKTKDEGGKIIAVCGPALLHSGAGPALAELVHEGYIDGISAGNGFAVHDLERDLYGTSLGMDVETLDHPRKGHKHHIYTISEIIRAGGIEAAVAEGLIDSGVMYECVTNDVPFVLAGSIRDDGPLPDTITDSIEAQNAIREQARGADMVLMLSTLLHSVAVGNCLPSTTKVVCVDISPATVTQLLDRGSAQAVGMVTDIGTFVPILKEELLG